MDIPAWIPHCMLESQPHDIARMVVRPKQPMAKSSHQLQLVIRGPPRLRKAQTPLDALQIFARYLIAHDMSRVFVVLMELLASRTLVNTNHGDSDRPCTTYC
jgi:hypothetical protein